MTDDWKIHREKQACDKPGCPLPTSDSYFAVLEWAALDPDKDGVTSCVRRELCAACFQDHERRCADGQPPIFWRATRKRSGSKEPVLDLQSLRMLFDRLGNVDDDRARALRFFCALLLLQKRVLKQVKPRTELQQRADIVLVDPKLKEMEPVALFAPSIDPNDLGGIKDELLAAIGEGDVGDDDDRGDGDRDVGDRVAGEAVDGDPARG